MTRWTEKELEQVLKKGSVKTTGMPKPEFKMATQSDTLKLVYPVAFPSLNEYVDECRKSPYAGAAMKKHYTNLVHKLTLSQEHRIRFSRVHISAVFFEANKRRDYDNIIFAMKFVLDGLQYAEVIADDKWTIIGSGHFSIALADSQSLALTLRQV